MIQSVKATSTADIALYIDDDQRDLYAGFTDGAFPIYGKRLGPAKSFNWLATGFPGYKAYGAATDDSAFLTPGWDTWVRNAASSFKGGVGAMAPYSPSPMISRMDFPWVTGKWIEALGYFCHPRFHHSYWDIVVETLADETQIAIAGPDDFRMEHDGVGPEPSQESYRKDALGLVGWLAYERRRDVAKLRAAMET